MNLCVYYQNVRGLRTKTDTIYRNSLLCNFDVIALTETWLANHIGDSEIFDSSAYNVYRHDRDNTTSTKSIGGGSLVAVNKSIVSSSHTDWCTSNEDVWVSIYPGKIKKRINICCVYLVPNVEINKFFDFFNNLSTLVNDNPNDIFLIMGDFNLGHISWSLNHNNYYLDYVKTKDIKCSSFVDSITLSNLQQFNHLSNINNNILDLILTNITITNLDQCRDPIIPEDPLHKSVVFDLNFDLDKDYSPTNKSNQLNFFRGDYENINRCIQSVDWRYKFHGLDVDTATNMFYSILKSIIDIYIPKKTPSRINFPNWYKQSTVKLYKEKKRSHKKWQKYKNNSDYMTFSLLRRRLKTCIQNDYSDYIKSVQENCFNNSKNFWRFIASKRSKSNIPTVMTLDDVTVDDSVDICDSFNKYFQSVFEPSLPVNIINNPKVNYSHINLHLSNLSLSTIRNALSKLDNNKGAGPDGIPSVFVKSCQLSLCLPLYIIYNKSLNEGVFPLVWKQVIVTPILKSGHKHMINNYRPISKQSLFAKIFESVVNNYISSVIKGEIISNQHGFCKNRSTLTNLLPYSEYLFKNLDKSEQVDVVFTDFQKAFDKIDHYLLLRKLDDFGISGNLLSWLSSFIIGRSQAVTINGHCSDFVNISSGVPQGSHLGPTLFLIFINDISSNFQNCEFSLYADDLKIYKNINSVRDSILLQQDLSRFFTYCGANGLFLNMNKCNVITFTRKKHPLIFDYSLGNVVLMRVSEVRDLGVTFDVKLIFDKHIDSVCKRANKILGFIIRTCKHFTDSKCIVNLYKGLVCSILEYACVIWHPQYNVYIDRLERIQKKFTRFLDYRFFPNNKLPYNLRLQRYDIMSLRCRRFFMDMVTVYKIVNCTYNTNLIEYLNFNTPNYNTRQLTTFYTDNRATSSGKNSPVIRICNNYNANFSSCDLFFESFKVYKKNVLFILNS